MDFLKELDKWIDTDYLISNEELPKSPAQDGNPLVLAGIAACVIKLRNDNDTTVTWKLKTGVASLKSENGLFNHKIRSADQVTHDDLLGVCTYSYLTNKSFHNYVCKFGYENRWIMSNTGKLYFNAIARPWDIAFYQILGTGNTSAFLKFFLFLEVFFAAIFKGTSNGQKFVFMKYMCLKDSVLTRTFRFWYRRLNKKWGGIYGLLSHEYGTNHVFAKGTKDLTNELLEPAGLYLKRKSK